MIDVLIVAYHYPPIASAGTQRSVSFARYLPEFGFRPHVLTTNAFGSEGEGSVYRANEWVGIYRNLFNRAARDLPPSVRSRSRTGSGQSGLSRLSRRLLIPDGQVGWLPSAYRAARSILNTHPIRLILTTGPPFSSHLLGLSLHGTTHLPWVADFRDTWTYDPLDDHLESTTVRLGIERWMEIAILRNATHVTCVTDVAADFLKSRSGHRPVTLIPNGYEPGEVVPGSPSRAQAPVRFVHTGSFSASHPLRSPELLVRAAEKLGGEVDFEIVFVGPLTQRERAIIQPLEDAGRALVTGAVDREEALSWQRKADVLVVVDHPRDVLASNIPGKVYEYGAAGKPILAIASRGALRSLIREMGAGLCVRHDIDDIADAIRAFVRGEAGVSPDVGQWSRFERKRSVEKLARVFWGILKV